MEMKKMISGFLIGVVFLVIAITLIGTVSVEVDDAGDQLSFENRCTNAGCYYNESNTIECQIAENNITDGCANQGASSTLPLETLFESGGIVTLMFIAGGMLIVIGVGLSLWKGKH